MAMIQVERSRAAFSHDLRELSGGILSFRFELFLNGYNDSEIQSLYHMLFACIFFFLRILEILPRPHFPIRHAVANPSLGSVEL
jgi:hypothetical protein